MVRFIFRHPRGLREYIETGKFEVAPDRYRGAVIRLKCGDQYYTRHVEETPDRVWQLVMEAIAGSEDVVMLNEIGE